MLVRVNANACMMTATTDRARELESFRPRAGFDRQPRIFSTPSAKWLRK
jgi:hypothetical protein